MNSIYSLHCFENSEVVELFTDNSEIDVLERSDLIDWMRQLSASCEQSECIVTYVERNAPLLVSEMAGNEELRCANAGELIAHYLQFSNDKQAFDDILTGAFQLFHPCSFPILQTPANVLKRILELCMSLDFERTANVIAQSMCKEIVEGVVLNIGASPVLGDAVIELFGAHMLFSDVLQPSFSVASLTAAWIKYDFPKALMENFSDALTTPSKHKLILFVRDLCALGYSPTLGPLVDALLSKDIFENILRATLEACKEAMNCSEYNSAPVPEAIAVFTCVLRLVRQTFPVSTIMDNYSFNIRSHPPIVSICNSLKNLVSILKLESKVLGKRNVTRVKGAICLLFKELIFFRMKYVDQHLVDSGFLEAFIALCEAFPNNNTLAQILNESFTAIFSRGGIELAKRDVLFGYITEGEGSKLIMRICNFLGEKYQYSAVRSHSFVILRGLMAKTWYQEKGTTSVLIGNGKEKDIEDMVHLLDEEITGERFMETGTANVPSLEREECINYAGDTTEISLSPKCSPMVGEDDDENLHNSEPDTMQLETFLLRDSSSAQVQAYPSFRNVQLLFCSTTDDT